MALCCRYSSTPFALHSEDELGWLKRNWATAWRVQAMWPWINRLVGCRTQPLGRIRHYFGEKVSATVAVTVHLTPSLSADRLLLRLAGVLHPDAARAGHHGLRGLWGQYVCHGRGRRERRGCVHDPVRRLHHPLVHRLCRTVEAQVRLLQPALGHLLVPDSRAAAALLPGDHAHPHMHALAHSCTHSLTYSRTRSPTHSPRAGPASPRPPTSASPSSRTSAPTCTASSAA
jgi:hypothetical protein